MVQDRLKGKQGRFVARWIHQEGAGGHSVLTYPKQTSVHPSDPAGRCNVLKSGANHPKTTFLRHLSFEIGVLFFL